MTRRTTILVIASLSVLAVLLWLQFRPSPPTRADRSDELTSSPLSQVSGPQQIPGPSQPTQPIEQRRGAVREAVQGILSTPIAFYGKVIDQNGAPVADATINYGALDNFDAPGSQYQGKSDALGNFSISGITGAVLRVGVQKAGYYKVDGKSSAAFAYGMRANYNRKEPPTQDRPAIFVLHKMGVTEPLIKVDSRQIDVPKTGEPLSIDLGRRQSARGDMQIEASLGNTTQRPFDWRFRLSVPGGGLADRKGQFDFEAPANGYQPSVEVNMPSTAENWSLRLTKEYFARLSDGKYARFSIRFYPGDRNFVVVESYVNPKVGSRNLEFDPRKLVKLPYSRR
jgi:hypothetical protein